MRVSPSREIMRVTKGARGYSARPEKYSQKKLRCIANSAGAKKVDWPHFVKYIEFAYRRAPIPGTSVSPFVVARGRASNEWWGKL